jgi:hypothetical protein
VLLSRLSRHSAKYQVDTYHPGMAITVREERAISRHSNRQKDGRKAD